MDPLILFMAAAEGKRRKINMFCTAYTAVAKY